MRKLPFFTGIAMLSIQFIALVVYIIYQSGIAISVSEFTISQASLNAWVAGILIGGTVFVELLLITFGLLAKE